MPLATSRRWRATTVGIAATLVALGGLTGSVASAASVDPYDFTDWSTGARVDICTSGDQLRPGASALRDLVIATFGPSLATTPTKAGGTGVSPVAVCRTIRVSATCPTAGSVIGAPPPFSTCWSGHASGAAIDIFVHDGDGDDHTAAGDATAASIVDWLLEPVSGLDHLRARQLGIQEITFGDNTWTSNRANDRPITSWAQLDLQAPSGVAEHGDHVHLTLHRDGAAGLTGGYDATSSCLDGTCTIVPTLRGLSEADASAALNAMDVGSLWVDSGIACDIPHDGIGRGLVTGSDPESGAVIAAGDLVELFFAPPMTLRRNDKGPLVMELQQLLLDLGFDPNGIDGDFGGGTKAAVEAYQTSRGLVPVDGIVGCMTWQALANE